MSIIPFLSFIADLVVDTWLLVILWRRGAWRTLPWFTFYVGVELATACIGLVLWPVSRSLYVTVFWWTEAVRIMLIVGAMRESFVRTFVGFSSLRWFPWLVRGVIGGVLVYSGWKAIYAPPVHNNRIISLIVAGEFTFRWGIAAVGLLSLVLLWMVSLPRDTREVAVMDGCTIASVAFLVVVVSRSLFGTRYALITQFVPQVGYLIAVWIWIRTLSRPAAQTGFRELGMSPEEMALELQRYRTAAERLLKKTDSR